MGDPHKKDIECLLTIRSASSGLTDKYRSFEEFCLCNQFAVPVVKGTVSVI